MSDTTMQRFWKDALGIPISRSYLVNVIQKASSVFAVPYEELKQALMKQSRLGTNESGHKDTGARLRAWCLRASEFTLFHITQGTRSTGGQRSSERVWTMIATCRQQNRSVFDFFCSAIDAHFRQQIAPTLLP